MASMKILSTLLISLLLLNACKGNSSSESETKDNSSDATACICEGSFSGKVKIDGKSELLSLYCTGEIAENRGPLLFRNQQFNMKASIASPVVAGKQPIVLSLTPKSNDYSYEGPNCELNIESLTDLAPSSSCNLSNMQIAQGTVTCKDGILNGSSEIRDMDIVNNFKVSFNFLNQ